MPMTRALRKPKTAEQKERDRIQKIEYRKANKERISLQNSLKWKAGAEEREAKRKAKEAESKEAKQQRDLWSKFERAWLNEARPRFPDWSYIWTKERARITSNSRYRDMTPDERAEWNKNAWLKRKNDPEYRRKSYSRILEWKRRYPEKHLKSVRESTRRRKEKDPGFRVQCNLRNRFKDIMGSAREGGTSRFSSLVGCSTEFLAAHLEQRFARGMSWENYGTRWHVDHIMPCAAFDHTRPDHIARCWHWTNLQPLWAEDNLAKSDSIPNHQLSLTI